MSNGSVQRLGGGERMDWWGLHERMIVGSRLLQSAASVENVLDVVKDLWSKDLKPVLYQLLALS